MGGLRGDGVLVGRAEQCARIARLLDDARGQRSGVLVLIGEPGIGKSALGTWAAGQADGMRVLRVHPVETEADLPFAGLSELCAGELDRLERLPEPQARTLEAALARRDARPGDRFAIGAAVLSLLGAIAEETPALVIVDDAQWLDGSSADALLFCARRLRREGVALLIATRPGGRFGAQGSSLPSLHLDGLDAHAARELLTAAHEALPAAVADRLAERTGGNPLALLELPLALSPAQLAGIDEIDEPLPLGRALVDALLRRLSGLSDEARQAVLIAAAHGDERLQPVLDALDVLDVGRDTLEAAQRAGAVAITGERLAFCHPLLRSAVQQDASGQERRAAHAALARVTAGAEQAWHLAHAAEGLDAALAAQLEEVGAEARRRGAPSAAAAALQRAALLSPPGNERVRRLVDAAGDAHLAGRPAWALHLLDDALAGSHDLVQRARIQHARGRILVLQGQREVAGRLLIDAAAAIRSSDPDRAATMLAEACVDCLLGGDLRRAVAVARDAHRVAAGARADAQAFAGSMLAGALALHGERVEAGALLDRYVPILCRADPLTAAGQLLAVAAQCCFWLERHELAAELLDGLIGSARTASAPAVLLLPLCCRAELDFRLGRWGIAAAQLHEAADLSEEMAGSVYAAYALECLARLAAATGDEAGCRAHAARALQLIDQHHNEFGRLYVHAALGLLELGLGRMDAAVRSLELTLELAERQGVEEPNVVHWQADLVEAHVRAGDSTSAREVLVKLERQADRTGGRWALGVAARCSGLLATEEAVQDSCFSTALEHLHATGSPFEVARTHLCHGERLRRSGRRTQARQVLRKACEAFERLGAAPWQARAQVELRATGARPRRRQGQDDGDGLTAHELQVALLVAGGASNREAAAALFLSPKTIEFHLRSIYRKLGVRTRTELAGIAAHSGWLEAAPLHRDATEPPDRLGA